MSLFFVSKKKEICDSWVRRCLQLHKFNTSTARICSMHFNNDDYCLQQRLLNLPEIKWTLKPDAIPSKNLPCSTTTASSISSHQLKSERNNRMKKRHLLKDLDNFKTTQVNKTTTENIEIDAVESENQTNQDLKIDQASQTESIRDDILSKLELLQAENVKLREENKTLDTNNKNTQECLRIIFTEGQIRKLNSGNTRVYMRWSVEDIAAAISQHAAGPRAYRLLRKRGHPLPGVSTLRRWAGKVDVQPGILNVVLKLMKNCNLSKMERACIILFDEVKIQKMYDYDRKADTTIPPSNYAQVIMARGICGNWKQPIYYDYDSKVTKDLLFQIIEALETCEFPVHAINCDLGGGNRGLWKELGISENQTWFLNSVTNKRIHVFADVPHMMKLLRNHFLDSGFIIREKSITREPVVELLQISGRSDLNIAHKINSTHLTVKNAKRQKVKLATKLFSHTVSKAISRMGHLGLYKNVNNNWLECSELFKLTNDWFDVFNSKIPETDSRNRTKAYGLALDDQNKILDEMEDLMNNLNVKTNQNVISKTKAKVSVQNGASASNMGKKCKLPFQKGITISIKSLKLLFEDLKTDFHIKYVLTYHVNQDPLDGFFSIIRAIGGLHDHPTLIYYILGRNEDVISEAANVNISSNAPNLTSVETLKDSINGSNKNILDDDADEHNIVETDDAKIVTVQLFDHLNNSPLILEDDLCHDLSDIECDGLENLAGYIAFKFRKTENLGYATSSKSVPFTWVDHLRKVDL